MPAKNRKAKSKPATEAVPPPDMDAGCCHEAEPDYKSMWQHIVSEREAALSKPKQHALMDSYTRADNQLSNYDREIADTEAALRRLHQWREEAARQRAFFKTELEVFIDSRSG